MTNDNSRGIAVTFGLSATGLSVARSLVPHGITVYGIDVHRYEVGHFSRFVKHDKRFSNLPPGEELLKALIEFGRECPMKPVVFNADDQYIDFVAQNREALEPYFILTESMRPEVNTLFLNKRTFYESCEKLGVAMPKTFFPTNEEEAVKASKEIRYPAIVKPSYGYRLRKALGGKKLAEVNTPEELMHWWRLFESLESDVVLQECIPGPERNITVAGLYTDKDGKCLSVFTGRKIRQYPPMYGSGSYMEAEWLPEIAELSIDLVGRLNYHGVSDVEYKWDEEDSCWKLIEVNCRPAIWFSVTRGAGVDVAYDAYCDLIGKPNEVNSGHQDDRIRWQLFIRDVVSSLTYMRRGEMSFSDFCRTTISQKHKAWAVCAYDDWGANFGYLFNTAMQVWTTFIAPKQRAG